MSSTLIDTLDIKIKSDSSAAVKAIESLASSLNALKQSCSKVGTAAKQLDKFSDSLKKLGDGGSKGVSAITKLGSALKGVLNIYAIKKTGEAIGGWINSTNEWIENTNLFRTSLGQYADEATEYAELLQDKLGIDSSEFMRAQGVFMSMANGFGLASDKAYQLSKGMTEVSYDLASFFNLPIEEAFLKVRSGIAGELEPLRALGFALSQATLEELALSKGITKAVASMTEAEKAQLRYTAIVEQATQMGAIGDLVKTLESPSNAIRILKQQIVQLGRALGSVFIPILTQVIPYVQAFVKVLTSLISRLAVLVGFEMPDWTSSDWNGISGASESLEDATENAKKLKSVMLGFDELNVIDPNQNSGRGLSAGGGVDLDLQEVWDQSLISQIDSEVDRITAKFTTMGLTIKNAFLENKDLIFDFIMVLSSVGAGLAAWKGITVLAAEGATGFGIITSAVAKVVAAVKGAWAAIVAVGSGISGALAPALAVIAAVAGAVYVLWENWSTVVEVFKGFINQIDLAGKFESIKKAVEPLAEKVAGLKYLLEAIGTVVVGALAVGFSVVAGLFNALVYAAQGLIDVVSGVLDILTGLGQFLVGVFTGDLELVKLSVENMLVGIYTAFAGACELIIGTVVGFVEGVIEWFVNLWDVLVGHSIVPDTVNAIIQWFNTMWTKGIEVVKGMVNGIITWWNTLKTNTVTAFTNIKDTVVDKVKSLWTSVTTWYKSNVAPKLTASYWATKFDGLKEGFKTTIKNMLNSGIDMLNKFISWLNSKMTFSWKGLTILGKQIYPGGSVQLVSIPQITQRFEDGGFIEDGLFTMNKGEIAGKFNNGKSVVANNEQIIEGISQGVYAAFTKALSENSGSNTYHFYLDGKEIRASIKKNEADSGLSLFGSELGYGY